VFKLSPDAKRYVPTPSSTPTQIPEPGLPFSLVFRAEPGREDVILRIASAYEAASRRRIPPPAFGPLSAKPLTNCPACKKPVRKVFSSFSSPRKLKPLSTTDAKKAGFQVYKRLGKGEYERQ